MSLSTLLRLFILGGLGLVISMPANAQSRNPVYWDVHDSTRTRPPVVEPGPAPADPLSAPSDATVLFDGDDLSKWEHPDGSAASWTVENGYMEVKPGSGPIRTKEAFGDVQLHVEWMVPTTVEGEGQSRGNSGVFLMGTYEVQVLDSHENQTYADGQAAAIYGQYPPLVNAMRPQGEWQTYDIVFHRPHFDEGGTVVTPARFTVYHNGILVQDNVELTGPTAWKERPPYEAHAPALPLRLQDHDNAVRFRNIWVRELE
ncbi:hypothetical protein BSZ35_06080 [Salinibacter sp. 10B]|nr:hypothetical protein BSZ35_06080 [Salinibacter sp. 10B]